MTQGPPAPAFADRRDAGCRLAAALVGLDLAAPVVLALPRGGVPVGFEVARALRAPLDILIVRKIGAPGAPDYGLGAVVDGDPPQRLLNDEVMRAVRPTAAYLEAETARQFTELERRRAAYRDVGARRALAGRTAIVVDDGVATGGTVRVALRALREAERVVLALPVAPPDTLAVLRQEAEAVVCLEVPAAFEAVGLHYADFAQTPDAEVVALLRAARDFEAGEAAPAR